jgi:hypothetical protein
MSEIVSMGHATAIGMRTPAPAGCVVINTCSGNDTAARGTDHEWTWSNPTNRAIVHPYEDVEAVSVECLWQGTKCFDALFPAPDSETLRGAWRRGKAKRPVGAWAGRGRPLITSSGEARRRIYLPAFARLIAHWMADPEIADRVARARRCPRPIFLRDWDIGRGLDQNGPMSHAWALCVWLNTGALPT